MCGWCGFGVFVVPSSDAQGGKVGWGGGWVTDGEARVWRPEGELREDKRSLEA